MRFLDVFSKKTCVYAVCGKIWSNLGPEIVRYAENLGQI